MARHAGALNDKYISSANVILDIDVKLTIAERHDLEPAEGRVEDVAYRAAEREVRATRQDDQFAGHRVPIGGGCLTEDATSARPHRGLGT